MAHQAVKFREADFAAVLQLIRKGKSLRTAAKQVGVDPTRIIEWVRDDAAVSQRYAQAKDESADVLAEEIVDLADEAMQATTSEQAQAYRLRVDARKWVAAKLKPKKYGERLEHAGTGKDGAHIVRVITGVPPPDDIGKQL